MMDKQRRGYADGPFGQVHYRVAGDGKPLVLLHQAPQTSRQFTNVYPRLAARGFQAIGIDLPGFGESDPPDFAPRVEDYATSIPPVLDALGLAQADILGHHTGALVATEVSLQFPSRVRRLILNGPLPLADGEVDQWMPIVDREKKYAPKIDGGHLTEIFAQRVAFANGTVPLEDITRCVLDNLIGYGPFWYGHNAAFTYDHAAAIPRITHPTLILTNTGDVIFDHALKTHKMRPDFAFASIEGGGIDIVDQQPDAWVDAVARFLEG
jgi:pimeloyl-ACP methyl ester carboxylesterase